MVRKHKDIYETEQHSMSIVNALAGNLSEAEKVSKKTQNKTKVLKSLFLWGNANLANLQLRPLFSDKGQS